MSTGFFNNPVPINEPIYSYIKGSAERIRLQETIAELRGQQIDISMRIGGEDVRGSRKTSMICPHDHQHILGHYLFLNFYINVDIGLELHCTKIIDEIDLDATVFSCSCSEIYQIS